MYMIYWIIIGAGCGVAPLALGYRPGRAMIVGLVLAIAGSIITGLLINSFVASETGSVHPTSLLASACVGLVLAFGCNMMMQPRRSF